MRVAIIGASGGIGGALVRTVAETPDISQVWALARSGDVPTGETITPHAIDIENEANIEAAARAIAAGGDLDLVIVAIGMLSDGNAVQPEKSWRDQSMYAFEQIFRANTFGPALVAKHFLPLLPRKRRAVFAALSARVGSISDNRLGGWHAYRASKAALNMLIRNYALELSRKNPDAICVGLHPGTVATPLSAPFVSADRSNVLSPQASAAHLLSVIDGLTPSDTGKLFDALGREIIC